MSEIKPRQAQGPRPGPELEDQTLREALQVHARVTPWPVRLRLFEQLLESGLRRFQVGSLVRPDRMPQMAGTDELIQAIGSRPGVEIWALVLNRQGLERARACGLQGVALSASLSPRHSRRNLGRGVEEGLERARDLAREALEAGLMVRMGLQCAFGGPLLPPPAPQELARRFAPFHDLGVRRLALADTAGRATPQGLAEQLEYLHEQMPRAELGLHLHGPADKLAANLEAVAQGNAAWLDATLGGRGGCPFLPGPPPANLSLRQAAECLAGKGLGPGLDLERLDRAANALITLLSYGKVVKRKQAY
ncbi:MAG: hypothetical protein K9K66_06350 [Desulfarculaceae bacterium]|nr:hypothetical protein [Desulfarculaceae bacterium]MCF8071138.1 hypothetical protein [Desulfarculaceae bacterium]MCF8101259.1 hypothetical protein [Desulfarculaceae bacterium]MCF8115192.1 hypothetical protein [Desulfarculaceae bacterium]